MERIASAPGSGASSMEIVALICVLAGLDVLGAVMAKEWTAGRSPWMFLGGMMAFVLLFGVYALGLELAEMSTITFGWIAGLQAAILILERVRYDVSLPPGKWVAIVVMFGLQAYLVLAPSGTRPDGPVLSDTISQPGAAEVSQVREGGGG